MQKCVKLSNLVQNSLSDLIGKKNVSLQGPSIERGTFLLLSGECQRQIPTQKESDILRNACKMQMPMDPILILTT